MDGGLNSSVVQKFAGEVGLDWAVRPPNPIIAWYSNFLNGVLDELGYLPFA